MAFRFMCIRSVASLALFLAAMGGGVHATEGVNLIGMGPIQKSLGGAGVASVKNSSWVLLNPASLTELDRQFSSSMHLLMPTRSLDSSPAFGSLTDKSTDDSVYLIPTFSAKLGEWLGVHWGVGFFGSSGMGTDYDNARIPYFGGDSSAQYGVGKLVLAGAVDLGDGWSVGAGPVVVLSRIRTDMFNGVAPSADDWDYAWGIGYSVGVLKRWDRLSIGLSYLSEQRQEVWDKYTDLMHKPLSLPEQVQVGISYAVTESLEVMLDYRFVHWSGVPQWGDEPNAGGFGWDDQHCVKLGVEWEANEDLTLRAGVSYGKSPIDSSAVFANGLFPAIMETHVALGFTYRWSEKLDLHATYVHAFYNSLTDDGSQMGGMGKGTSFSMYQNGVSAGMTYHF